MYFIYYVLNNVQIPHLNKIYFITDLLFSQMGNCFTFRVTLYAAIYHKLRKVLLPCLLFNFRMFDIFSANLSI